MAARDVVRRIPTYLVGVIACFAMFDIPSAYAYFRGAPWGVALAVGLFVFPALPVGWHVWSERRAKKVEKPKPKKTTGMERFVFRTIVVAVIALGGLVLVARGRVWTAIKNDALWFVPTSLGSLAPDSKLLDKVPPSAHLVVWVRPTDEANALVGSLKPGAQLTEIIVGARGGEKDGQAIVIERGELLLPIIAQMQTIIMGFTAQNGIRLPSWGSVVNDSGGAKTWSTPGWANEIGTGRAPVIELVRRAPDDAFIVAVAKITPPPTSTTTPPTTPTTPTTPATPSIPSAKNAIEAALVRGATLVMWARAPRENLEIDVMLETADEAAATILMAELDKEIAAKEKSDGKTLACWRKHSSDLYLRREGANLHARAEIDIEGMKAVFHCLDMAKK